MKKTVLSSFFILLSVVVKAQSPPFMWAKNFTGTSSSQGNSCIAVDLMGNVYTTGFFNGQVDFDAGSSIYNLGTPLLAQKDIFISKYSAAGNFIWAKKIGGPNDDVPSSLTIDAAGDVFTTGYFSGTVDFDPGAGIFNITSEYSGESNNVFILKLDTDGNFIWAKKIAQESSAGPADFYSYSIATDDTDNVYVVGDFQTTGDFDPDSAHFDMTASGISDVFILKLNATGHFVWAKHLGSYSRNYRSNSITVDETGNVYTAGTYDGLGDFDPGPGTFLMTPSDDPDPDSFILKLNAAGSFVWAKSLNGSGSTTNDVTGMRLDKRGNLYITGDFQRTVDFDPGPATYNLTAPINIVDLFILKLTTAGNFLWAENIGGTVPSGDFVKGNSITSDTAGNIFCTGYFAGTVDFDPDTTTHNLISYMGSYSKDIFISKSDTAGNLLWVKQMGGTGDDIGTSIAVDAWNNIYTTGTFKDTVDFDPDSLVSNLTAVGIDNIFIQKLGTSTVGINEYSDAGNISVFPNPSNGLFILQYQQATMQNEKMTIEVYNILGAKIYSETQQPAGQYYIDLSACSKGIYFFQLKTGNRLFSRKVIIQ